VLTAEGSLTSRKVLQLVPERVGGWCWDDIVRHCIPDHSSGNWKSSVGNAKKIGIFNNVFILAIVIF